MIVLIRNREVVQLLRKHISYFKPQGAFASQTITVRFDTIYWNNRILRTLSLYSIVQQPLYVAVLESKRQVR